MTECFEFCNRLISYYTNSGVEATANKFFDYPNRDCFLNYVLLKIKSIMYGINDEEELKVFSTVLFIIDSIKDNVSINDVDDFDEDELLHIKSIIRADTLKAETTSVSYVDEVLEFYKRQDSPLATDFVFDRFTNVKQIINDLKMYEDSANVDDLKVALRMIRLRLKKAISFINGYCSGVDTSSNNTGFVEALDKGYNLFKIFLTINKVPDKVIKTDGDCLILEW